MPDSGIKCVPVWSRRCCSEVITSQTWEMSCGPMRTGLAGVVVGLTFLTSACSGGASSTRAEKSSSQAKGCAGSTHETVLDYGRHGDEEGPDEVATSLLESGLGGVPRDATVAVHRAGQQKATIVFTVDGQYAGKVLAIALADGKWVASRISVCA